jgi:L-lactate utilization protein LutC
VYPGPIGAILTPQLNGLREGRSLPWASSLCGACYEVCPVAIDIPRVLVHLRGRVVSTDPAWKPEKAAMKGLYRAFSSRRSFETAQRAARLGRPLARRGRISRLPWPLSGWTETRDLPVPPAESFRDWWRRERGEAPAALPAGDAPNETVDMQRKRWDGRGQERVRAVPRQTGDARTTILGRIREALGDDRQQTEVKRDYRRKSDRPRTEIVELFAERVGEYRATVIRAAAAELASVLGDLAQGKRLAIPADLHHDLRPQGAELVLDHGLSAHELDDLDGALTACAVAIAETGTIVLDGGPGQGRRALTLVPDYHLCIVREDQVVGLVPEAIEALAPAVGEGRPLTFVSGPSATSDIELNRVEGVHGPRTLHVVVAG